MTKRVALCVDHALCEQPERIGLPTLSQEGQSWIDVFTSGSVAREGVAAGNYDEAWVVSCDDVAAINLAATLKADSPALAVSLVSDEPGGSVRTRARTAEIDEVISTAALAARCHEGLAQQAAWQNVLGGVPAVAPLCEQREKPALSRTKQARSAFVLPVVGGSGGVGKSAVSVMGALVAEQLGYRTLLVDFDLQFGDAALLLGGNALSLDEAVQSPSLLGDFMSGNATFSLLSAPSRMEMAEVVTHGAAELLGAVRPHYDVVIANTGAAWAEQNAILLEQSSAALFLVDQRSSSLWTCKHALELCIRCGIATGSFIYAVNRCAKSAPYSSIDVSCALQGAPVYELKDGGRDVEDYLAAGSARELLGLRNDFVTSLRDVFTRILPHGDAHADAEPPAKKQGKSRSRKLLRAVGGR